MIQPNFQDIAVGELIKVHSKSVIECKLKTLISDVKKIVSISGNVFLIDSKTMSDSIVYNAKVQATFVYMSSDGLIKKQNGVEFQSKIDLDGSSAKCVSYLDLRLCEIELKTSNGEYYLEGVIEANGTALIENSRKCLAGGEFLIKEGQISTNKILEQTTQNFGIDDKFEVNYPIEQLIQSGNSIFVTSVKCGIGSISIEGDVYINLCVMPMLENSDILEEKLKIPFRLQLENNSALPNMKAIGDANLKDVSYKIVTDEARGKSSIEVSVSLVLSANAMESQTVTYVEDCYSANYELDTKLETVNDINYEEKYYISQRLQGQAICVLPENSRLIATHSQAIEILQKNEDNSFDAICKCSLIFKMLDGEYVTKSAEMPVQIMTNCDGDISLCNYALIDFNAKIRGADLEFDCVCKLSYIKKKSASYKIVSDVIVLDEKLVNDSAITLYIARKGDTLWDVSKQVGMSGNKILECNENLTFPLEDKQKIIVYRQEKI